MTSGIYQIKNKLNGNRYIGSAVNISHRWKVHLSTLRHGQHYNRHLQRAFKKYGESAFEFSVLEQVTRENLIEREQYFLNILNPEYNVAPSAGTCLGRSCSLETRRKLSKALRGRTLSDEHRRKLSEAKSGKQNPMYGKYHSKETRGKISRTLKGHQVTEMARKKMSNAKRGTHLTAETRAKLSKALIGHSVSGETRRKISEGHKGKYHSDETRAKMREAQKMRWHRERAVVAMGE